MYLFFHKTTIALFEYVGAHFRDGKGGELCEEVGENEQTRPSHGAVTFIASLATTVSAM
jgi:hypothetical protein